MCVLHVDVFIIIIIQLIVRQVSSKTFPFRFLLDGPGVENNKNGILQIMPLVLFLATIQVFVRACILWKSVLRFKWKSKQESDDGLLSHFEANEEEKKLIWKHFFTSNYNIFDCNTQQTEHSHNIAIYLSVSRVKKRKNSHRISYS